MTELQALHILGLDPNKAVLEDVKPAYRAKAKLLHPDKGGDSAAFKQLVAAYELLAGKSRVRRPVQRARTVRVGCTVWICRDIPYSVTTSAGTTTWGF